MQTVKLLIWDLDETLWDGTIEEDSKITVREDLIESVRSLNERGVISTICSNNSFDLAKSVMVDQGIFDLFIMPNINYSSKGIRVRSLIEKFQLRPQNVVFIDDNEFNLNEVLHYNEGINVMDSKNTQEVKKLLGDAIVKNKIDSGKRFKRYQVLEKKNHEKTNYDSNEEFLRDSDIVISFETPTMESIARIHELVQRTNQLNYTKKRDTKEQIADDINNHKSFIIRAEDKYGKYGEVGFVCYSKETVIHFVFSCRVLNMGVPDFVYHHLNLPKFEIAGEVASDISSEKPDWIRIGKTSKEGKGTAKNLMSSKKNTLMIGGCDLSQMLGFLENDLDIETHFNYTHEGVYIHRDSIDFLLSPEFDSDTKKFILETVPFISERCFEKPKIQNRDIIIYSPLIDYIQGKYENKDIEGFYISCNPFFHKEWNEEGIKALSVDRKIPVTKLKEFAKVWKPVEKSIQDFRDQLKKLISDFSTNSAKTIIILGAETTNSNLDVDKFEKHSTYNSLINEIAMEFPNVETINPTEFITGREDFTDSIRHYKKYIYKKISDEVKKIIKSHEKI